MIKQYRLKLKAENETVLTAISGYNMYGVLTELIASDYATILHENGINPISQYIQPNLNDKSIDWVVNLLSKEAANQVAPVLENNNCYQINSCNCKLTVKDISITVIPSVEALLERARALPDVAKPSLDFISSTSFKSNGDYLLFPSVEHIIRNLVNRWNSYSQLYPIDDEDAITSLIQSIKIAGYRLQSSYYRLKGTKIPGFKGEVRFSTRMSVPIAELFKILLYFSEYSGIGIKTSLGMGATKIKINDTSN